MHHISRLIHLQNHKDKVHKCNAYHYKSIQFWINSGNGLDKCINEGWLILVKYHILNYLYALLALVCIVRILIDGILTFLINKLGDLRFLDKTFIVIIDILRFNCYWARIILEDSRESRLMHHTRRTVLIHLFLILSDEYSIWVSWLKSPNWFVVEGRLAGAFRQLLI